jgi:hypothetical protein
MDDEFQLPLAVLKADMGATKGGILVTVISCGSRYYLFIHRQEPDSFYYTYFFDPQPGTPMAKLVRDINHSIPYRQAIAGRGGDYLVMTAGVMGNSHTEFSAYFSDPQKKLLLRSTDGESVEFHGDVFEDHKISMAVVRREAPRVTEVRRDVTVFEAPCTKCIKTAGEDARKHIQVAMAEGSWEEVLGKLRAVGKRRCPRLRLKRMLQVRVEKAGTFGNYEFVLDVVPGVNQPDVDTIDGEQRNFPALVDEFRAAGRILLLTCRACLTSYRTITSALSQTRSPSSFVRSTPTCPRSREHTPDLTILLVHKTSPWTKTTTR